MRRSKAIRRQREGYTLIELLVVIGIIVLLIGLLLPAVTKARDAAKRAQVAGEIGELELAIESFKTTYDVKYVPSALILCSDYPLAIQNNPTWAPALLDSQQYLSKVWPKVMWGSTTTNGGIQNPSLPANTLIPLDGNQVLVFLLGGTGPSDSRFTAPGWNGNRSGFLNSPTNPFNNGLNGGTANSPPSGDKAKGAFFNFKADRIDTNSHYSDPYGWPYYYFSSKNGNDYGFFGMYKPALNQANDPYGFTAQGGYGGNSAKGAAPMNPFVGTDGKFIRPDSFQIVSAGKNNLPAPGGYDSINNQVIPYNPGVGPFSPGAFGGDDIANFHRGMLSGDE